MHIIIGLGNPGLKYAKTRHNVGFVAVDALARELGVKIRRARFQALTAEASIAGEKVLLMKPQTFMNLSGNAVAEAARFYKDARIIVLYDDIDIDVGRLRIKARGSAGTHNGMRSIISCLGMQEFPRIRIGIGKPKDMELTHHVLKKFAKDERALVAATAEFAADAARMVVEEGVEAAQQRYNGALGAEK